MPSPQTIKLSSFLHQAAVNGGWRGQDQQFLTLGNCVLVTGIFCKLAGL
ncbi:MAG: hypothetical protein ACXV8O_20100 [Methylobacter sp.]